jgi:electron transport complex protein RnfG
MAVKSSFKNMTICLLAICLVCSGLLAGVYALTAEPIAAAAAAKNEAAIKEVLPETAVTIEEERTVDFEGASYAYNLAYDEQGNTVGCAINVSPVGFGGPIVIKVGFNAEGLIWNTKVLSQAETPGLGAKCTEPSFSDQFKQFNPAEKSLKVKKDGGDVDAITASTITSRAYANGLAVAVNVFNTIVGTPMPLDSLTGASFAGEGETK